MNMALRKFENSLIGLGFGNDGNLWLNATHACKHFDKKPHDFTRLKSTKEYIEALNSVTGITRNGEEYVRTINGGNLSEEFQGTWIHKSLGLLFARWLSADFAVWCDLQFTEMLKSKLNPEPVKIAPTEKSLQERIVLLSSYTENPFQQEKSVKFEDSTVRFDMVDLNESNRRVIELKNSKITPDMIYKKVVIKEYPRMISKCFGNNTVLTFVSPYGIEEKALSFIKMLKHDITFTPFNEFIQDLFNRVKVLRAGDNFFMQRIQAEYKDLL